MKIGVLKYEFVDDKEIIKGRKEEPKAVDESR